MQAAYRHHTFLAGVVCVAVTVPGCFDSTGAGAVVSLSKHDPGTSNLITATVAGTVLAPDSALISEKGAAVISDQGAGIVSNNSASLVGKSQSWLLYASDALRPFKGAVVTASDLHGQALEGGVANVDDQGHFRLTIRVAGS